MNIKDLLIEARRLVESGWTQDALMRDANGYATLDYTQACSYCLIGALDAALCDQKYTFDIWAEILDKARPLVGGSLSIWNDYENRTKEEVLELLDKLC